jgi:hypothetical protein
MNRIIRDTITGTVVGSALIFVLAFLPGNHFFSLREIGTTIGLCVLSLLNFVILLNQLTWLSLRLKWVIFLSVNVVYAAWSSFDPINIKTLRNSLFVACLVLVLLNVLISSPTLRKNLP